ncbi:MAG: phage tail assembly chaperone [Pseudomonadota bacterium]
MSPTGLPWPRLMELGFGVLGLSSDAFWSMTLPELDAALAGKLGRSVGAPRRGDLAALMRQFPDAADNGTMEENSDD